MPSEASELRAAQKRDDAYFNAAAIKNLRKKFNRYPSKIPSGRGNMWVCRAEDIEPEFLGTMQRGNFVVIDCRDSYDYAERDLVQQAGGIYIWLHFTPNNYLP